jgi:dolichol-phosphate mannosyltransferase
VSHTLVIVPTYNERENLAPITARILHRPDLDVLVVDDNSPDGTGDIADLLAQTEPRLHVLHRTGKDGLGTAYREGFAWGLARDFEVLVELDGDGSHQPEQLGRLLDHIGTADLVIGSRWVRGGRVENWPLRRELLSRGGSLYARLALGMPFRDVTGGYRAFSAAALRAIDVSTVESQGYCFQIDMLWRAYRAGLRIDEVPITFVERQFGVSKMSSGIVREAIAMVTRWGLHNLPTRIDRMLHAGRPGPAVAASAPSRQAKAHVS